MLHEIYELNGRHSKGEHRFAIFVGDSEIATPNNVHANQNIVGGGQCPF